MASSSGGMTRTDAALAEIDELKRKVVCISTGLSLHFDMVHQAKDIVNAQFDGLMSEGFEFQAQLDKTYEGLVALRLLVETPPPPPPPPPGGPGGPGQRPPPPPTPLTKAPPPIPAIAASAALVPHQATVITSDNYWHHLSMPSTDHVMGPEPWTKDVPPVDAVFPQNLPQVPPTPPPGTPKTSPGTPKTLRHSLGTGRLRGRSLG
jgi:hypothetical protein